jgi:acetyl-CoA carboxylase biotin carboxyl carrier protein
VPYTEEEVRQIMEAIERSDWEEVHLRSDGFTLVVSKSGPPTLATTTAAPAEAPAAPAALPSATRPPTPASVAWPQSDEPMEVIDEARAETTAPASAARRAGGGNTVLAPSLGLFWRSPKPGAPPFVEVGDAVDADSTVCIVEVMKLMNHVKAGTTGVVTAIHVENGEMVEYGQPLVSIAPDPGVGGSASE